MPDEHDSFDPYQTSADPLSTVAERGEYEFLRPLVHELAKWQRFLSIIMTIGTCIAVLFMLLMLGTTRFLDSGGPGIAALVCVVPVIILFYVLATVLFWKAASAAKQFANSGSQPDLGDFATTQNWVLARDWNLGGNRDQALRDWHYRCFRCPTLGKCVAINRAAFS